MTSKKPPDPKSEEKSRKPTNKKILTLAIGFLFPLVVLLVFMVSVIVEFIGTTHFNQCLVLSGTSVNHRLINDGNYHQ